MPQFYFPLFHSVTFYRFSLFSKQEEHQRARTVAMEGVPVLCLVGANGIGKTTTLAAIRYGLTGCVPHPDRQFKSVDEFYSTSQSFARIYFEGRIRENDRTAAAIGLKFTINNSEICVIRQIFGDVCALNINGVDLSTEGTPKSLSEYYEKEIERASGVGFKQFNFLQNVLFNFDDQHKLIFWDDRLQRQLLHLAFGVSPDTAQRAEILARDVEKADSLMRNAQWQISQAKKRLDRSSTSVHDSGHPDFPAATLRHTSYKEELSERLIRVAFIDEKIKELNDTLARLLSKEAVVSKEYQSVFRSTLSAMVLWKCHPIVANSSNGDSCHLCGSRGPAVQEFISARLQQPECPLCGTLSQQTTDSQEMSMELARLDIERRSLSELMRERSDERQRFLTEQELQNAAIERLRSELLAIETAFPTLLTLADSENKENPIVHRSDFERDLRAFVRIKEDQTLIRDNARTKLLDLNDQVQLGYAKAETVFIPIFKQLAEQFIGMNVHIELIRTKASSGSAGVRLSLKLNETIRDNDHMLSESQKFFIDIALRMALAKFMANGNTPTTLFIDTPEGSLDIAYEARAGEMFAQFVSNPPDSGHIIMTANLNSSKLLLRLAERCRKDMMRIERMTSWANLSSVQREAEAAFDDAYSTLNQALEGA